MEDLHHVPNLPVVVEAEQTHLRVPTRLDWIEPAIEYLKQKAVLCGACQEARAIKLAIALQEALNNAVIHGNFELSSDLREGNDAAFAQALAERAADRRFAARSVTITVDYDGIRCQWSFTDEGRGFDVERLWRRNPQDAEGLHLASGRGILIMRTFMDDVRYEEGGRRIILTLYKASGEEKRRHTRTPLHQRVRVAPIRSDGTVDWNAASEALSRNFSQGGMAILHTRLTTAERVLIGIDTEGQPLYFPAEVRHWRKVGEDMVELGCRFLAGTALSRSGPAAHLARNVEEVIGRLIDGLNAAQLAHDERRAHPRVSYTEQIGILGKPLAAPAYGIARDLSKSGMAFITTAPLPLEATVLALPQLNHPPLRVRVQIVRCAKILEGYYDVGARFLGLAADQSAGDQPTQPGAGS